MRAILAGLVFVFVSPALAGSWKHDYVANDGNVLTYVEDGKIAFYVSCGRGFVIAAKYPGKPGKDGADGNLTISTSRASMTFKGQFEKSVDYVDPEPRKSATTWYQVYLGLMHTDPRVFGDAWNAKKARVLDMLDSHGPITISAGKNSYQLPAIEVESDWHKAIDVCKFD
jgi:hypothetical protein